MSIRKIGWSTAGGTLTVFLISLVPGGCGIEHPIFDGFMYSVIPFWAVRSVVVGGGAAGLWFAFGQFPLYGGVLALVSGRPYEKLVIRVLIGLHVTALIVAGILRWRLEWRLEHA